MNSTPNQSDEPSGAAEAADLSTRIILYTGKGGVGKSTVAAATATLAAAGGQRSLVVSIDSAHNLSDIFQTRLGPEPTQLSPKLAALEVDINREIEENWSAVIDFFRNLTFGSSLANQVVAEECAILPGMEEVFGLTRLLQVAQTGDYDLIVVDSPPTGDMMKILRMPDVLEWFMRKYYPLEKKIAQTVWPVVSKFSGMPVPSEEYFRNLEQTYQQVQQVSRLLMDHARSSLRLVMTPDTISFAETKRAYAMACLFGFNVDAVVINKLLPEAVGEGFFRRWLETQQQVLAESEKAFDQVPRLLVQLEDSEPIGLARLQAFGAELFQTRQAAEIFVSHPAMELAPHGESLELRLYLPLLKRDHFTMWVKDDTLLINLHNTRKQITLPRALENRTMQGAKYDAQTGVLCVHFV